jgi:hypothetical protein
MKLRKTSIAKFAKSNFFIPSLVFILVIVGWFFLLITDSTVEEETSSVSWSQKEDYKIEETSKGIFVINEEAGISFKVPEGWEIEMGEENNYSQEEYWITLLDPKTILNENDFSTKGCALSLWVELSEKKSVQVKNEIEIINQNPEEYKSDINSTKEIIKIDNRLAIKWTGRSEDEEIYQKTGKVIKIKAPLRDKVFYIDARILPEYEEKCSQNINNFLKNISVK